MVTIEAFLLNTLRRFFNLQGPDEHERAEGVPKRLRHADARIFEEAERQPKLLGMGTTLTLAFAVSWKLYLAHAGDSRCYLFSQDELRQLTQDHTMIAELVRRGALSPQAASSTRTGMSITNVLGGHEPGVQVEMHGLDLEPGDTLLLCSDGLTEMVPDDRLAAILREEREPRRLRTVAGRRQRGGRQRQHHGGHRPLRRR